MPSKSRAQFGEMGRLYRRGKITRAELHDYNHGVHPKSLPKHSRKKKRPHAAVDQAIARRIRQLRGKR
jgi:hypothetical protein